MRLMEITEGLRDPADNPCWKGYKPVGTKQKGGRTVPNCVPKESVAEDVDHEIPDLEEVGEPVKSIMDAERRMAAGDRIFVAHEMDEEPFEIFNVDDLKGYTYDQVLVVPADINENTAKNTDQYYAVVSKVNNKVLSTHQDLESAKDEWRGLDSGQRALFRVVTTKKKPQDWSLDEDNKDDSSRELNPFTKFALKKIRARHPQAKSELDALIADLNSGQQQDRRDIGRLDQENDQEEVDIDRLDVENDRDDSRLDHLEQELAAIKRLIK